MTDNKLRSLNEIFTRNLFRIPDFQRGYSWEKLQLEDFWEDLIQLKNGRVHYTGLLTVESIDKSNTIGSEKWSEDQWLLSSGFKAYYLVDGQQRITTSMILINEVLKRLDEDDEIHFERKSAWTEKFLYRSHKDGYKSYIFGYEKDDPSDEFYKTEILGQDSSYSDKVPNDTLYTKNLKNASSFFCKKLDSLDKEKIKSLFVKLVNDFKFNFYEIDNELDIYVTFETMNNRGKSLSNLELLKNRLIYLTSMLEGDHKPLRRDINEAWKTIYAYLGKNDNNKQLDDDSFLFDHWVMYFDSYNRNEAASYAKYLLNSHFTVHGLSRENNKITAEEIKKYIQSLQEAIKYWIYLNRPGISSYDEEVKEWLYKINRIGIRHFSPLLMAVMKEEKSQGNLLKLLKEIERFIFLVFAVSQKNSSTGNSYIFRLAYKFHSKSISLLELINEIKYLTDGRFDNDDGDSIYEGYARIDNFLKNISEKKRYFYDWWGITYFLYEYEIHLQNNAKGEEKVSWREISKRNKDETIEHIYPQSADSDYWNKQIGDYVKGQKSREKVLHNLGNLLLLSRSKNSELQNDDFPTKKENKNGRGFSNGSYSEIEVSKNENWSVDEIKKRGLKMLEFMDNRWDINFDYWKINKEKLLELDDI